MTRIDWYIVKPSFQWLRKFFFSVAFFWCELLTSRTAKAHADRRLHHLDCVWSPYNHWIFLEWTLLKQDWIINSNMKVVLKATWVQDSKILREYKAKAGKLQMATNFDIVPFRTCPWERYTASWSLCGFVKKLQGDFFHYCGSNMAIRPCVNLALVHNWYSYLRYAPLLWYRLQWTRIQICTSCRCNNLKHPMTQIPVCASR